MKTTLALVALSAALAAPAATGAAPKLVTLKAAVTKAYSPKHVVLGTVCKHDYQGNGYALVKVRVAGKSGLVALQFINGQGWFVMWYDAKFGKGVPVSQRANVRAEVTRLKAKCLAP
jgi:hypothetical protein